MFLPLIALCVGLVALATAWRIVRDTTLVATWVWCAAALGATAGLEIFAACTTADLTATAPWRYAARALLLCPVVSLVGAKRPQHGPWNFVVFSLWCILALPAAETLLANTGQALEVTGFRSWFLCLLIFVTLANGLPTRNWAAALLATAGQSLLLGEYLPWPLPMAPSIATDAGLICLATGAVAFALRGRQNLSTEPLDVLWRDFRDAFGLFWALRVEERLLAAGEMYRWPVRLDWHGWTTLDGRSITEALNPETRQQIVATTRGLLRRFVSNDWIDARLTR
jgi:hypothetical protein